MENLTYKQLVEENINVYIGSVNQVGYCNACTDRKIKNVVVVELRSLSFRLCKKCEYKLRRIIYMIWKQDKDLIY